MENAVPTASNLRGVKRHCLSCELPFYDLARSPIVCPNCGEKFKQEARVETNASQRLPPGRYPTSHGLGGWASQRTSTKPAASVVATGSDGATEAVSSEDADDVPDTDDETDGALLLDADTEIEDDIQPRNKGDNQND